MFQSLFRRAEEKVDTAITNVLLRALVVLPFIIAAGFGTAAMAIYAYRMFGPLLGNLVIAGAFCVVGLIIEGIVAARNRDNALQDGAVSAETVKREAQSQHDDAFDPMDRQVLGAVASAVGPLALPMLLKPVLRNLPLIAAIAAAGFVLTRPTNAQNAGARDAMQPAE